jgi:DNA-directed RNA polymerase specialized sigma24 family protein
MNNITQILSDVEQGDPQAAGQLLPLVYDELRKLAAAKMAQENPGQTLQATALVHEAYLRLVNDGEEQHWDHRGHFFAAAAEAMRRILVMLGLDSAEVRELLDISVANQRVLLHRGRSAVRQVLEDYLKDPK